MRHYYVTDFGEVELPDEPPFAVLSYGSPNKYFANGPYLGYIKYIEKLAQFAFERKGRLKKAPPFGAWAKANWLKS